MTDTTDRRRTGWLPAATLVAGNMIGTGVFTSLGFQVLDVPGAFGIAALWLIGGVVALCGALCYAELGAALPRSGGEYHLLSRAWHPLAGFLAGWLSMTVGFAAPIALAAAAFGEYAAGALFGGSAVAKMTAGVLVILLCAGVHGFSVRTSGRFQAVATLVKVAALTALAAAAWFAPATAGFTLAPAAGDWAVMSTTPFVVSLFFVAYSYSGWNAAVYIAGELRDPARDLPRALLVGTAVVTVLYIAFNVGLRRAVPVDLLRGEVDVALVAARHLFGDAAGRAVGALIALGLVSAVSAMMWAGPRVAATVGEDHRVFRVFSRRTAGGAPWAALVLQTVVALALLAAGGFRAVLVYTEFTLSLCTFAAVAGVLWLRFRRPDLPRPFRCPLHPLPAVVFLLATGYALVRFATSADQWKQSLAGFGTVLAGAAVFFFASRGKNDGPPPV